MYTPQITVVLGKGSLITVNAGEGGTAKSSVSLAEKGTAVTLTATPDDGYRFKKWQSEQVTVSKDNTFTMPDMAVTVKAVFEKVNPVTVTDDGNGTASADKTEAAAGETITLTAAPDDGCRLQAWQSGQVTVSKDNTFTMPDEAVSVKAVFKKTQLPVVTPKDAYVKEGQQATFTAEADIKDPVYQWYIDRNDGSGWKKISGATSATYTTAAAVTGNDGYKYRCSVSGTDSNEAVLHVSFTPVPVPPPKTGDGSMPLLWLFLLSASLLGIQALRKKSER